jgi:hypothetical protein
MTMVPRFALFSLSTFPLRYSGEDIQVILFLCCGGPLPLCLRRLCEIALLSFVGVYALAQNSPDKEASKSAAALRMQMARLPLALSRTPDSLRLARISWRTRD